MRAWINSPSTAPSTKSRTATDTPAPLNNTHRNGGGVADRQGFEPWRRSPAYTLSRRAPSTTRPPVRNAGFTQTCPAIASAFRMRPAVFPCFQISPPEAGLRLRPGASSKRVGASPMSEKTTRGSAQLGHASSLDFRGRGGGLAPGSTSGLRSQRSRCANGISIPSSAKRLAMAWLISDGACIT